MQNVLHFEATDPANSVTLYAVSYRYHVTDKTLWRTFCVKNAAPSHHAFLVENVSATSPPVATVSADKRTISLAITLLIKDQAYPFTLTSSVRTPKDPPTTLPISTSTLAVQSPCALIAGSGAVPAFNRTAHTGGKNPLTGSVTFTVNTNLNTGTGSTCSDIWIRVLCGVNDCGSAGAIYLQLMQQATPNTHQWKGTFTCPAVTPATLVTFCGGWKAGNYPVEITDGYDPVNLQGSIVDGSFFMAVNT